MLSAPLGRHLRSFVNEISSGDSITPTKAGRLIVGDAGLAREILQARPASCDEQTVFKPLAQGSLPTVEMQRLAGFYSLTRLREATEMASPHAPVDSQIRSCAEVVSDVVSSLLQEINTRYASERPKASAEVRFVERMRTAMTETTTAVVSSALWFMRRSGPDVVSGEALVLETFRLVPPAWLISRRLTEEHRGLVADALLGQEIFVSPLIIHYRSQSFESPVFFDAGRWTETNRRFWPSDFCPFGLGRSSCWFWQESLFLATTALESITKNYTIRESRFRPPSVRVAPILGVAGIRLEPAPHTAAWTIPVTRESLHP